ncbi:flagellar motor protein MotB [Thalassobacillus sp. CUG 92003]|uniref:flagellar motor protein MotB n=1 Tax=Thalassobacillus sp. CUG 92003 TaxID=2736641 RepID=UPI0015E7016C|nr:flagellar motor protein MotB [Thalassobacillus sp. CUG 92003]
MRRKKQHKDENHVDETWLIPYADMLTLLLALFIVLFAMSEVDNQRYEQLAQVFKGEFNGGNGILEQQNTPSEDPPPITIDEEREEDEEREQLEQQEPEENKEKEEGEVELRQLRALQDQVNNYIEKNNLADVFGTKLSDEGLLISIFNEVFFESGSATVRGEGETIAGEVSEFLHTDPPHQIVVSGHTDNRPINNDEFSSNWDLSVMRAVNFMSLLLENSDLDASLFSAKGYGEHNPVAPNDTADNRAKNRRVEILVLPNTEIES